MKSRLLGFHYTDKEDLPRILLYSVMVHYIFFYYLFGNPFLVLINRGSGPGGPEFSSQGGGGIDVELLSSGEVEVEGEGNGFSGGKRDFPVFPPEEGSDEADRIAAAKAERTDSLAEEGIHFVEGVAPPSPSEKKRKPPPNMTGPEDCMLKLVGMVCPGGEFDCIEAYKAFCTRLPE